MPKPTKEEILKAMKDPELLKEAGLQPIESAEEKELFSDITIGENDTMEDLVRKINDKSRRQRDYLRKIETNAVKAAEKKAGEGEAARQQKEVDAFLKGHPELSNNKELLGIVERLYHSGDSLEDAWRSGCKVLDLDPDTGKKPEEKKSEEKPEEKSGKEEKKEKKTPLKSDVTDEGLPGLQPRKSEEGEGRPKSIREIAGELSNEMAAKGNNPFRDS